METYPRDNVSVPGTMIIGSLSLTSILRALSFVQLVKAGELSSNL